MIKFTEFRDKCENLFTEFIDKYENLFIVICFIILIVSMTSLFFKEFDKQLEFSYLHSLDAYDYQERTLNEVIEKYDNTVQQLQTENSLLIQEIKLLKRKFDINVYATAYTARVQECDPTPNVTAIMEKPKAGWTIAVSHDLIYLLGKKVYIKGIGVRRVNDLMNERYTKRIDILMGNLKESKSFNNRKVQLQVIGE
jgi:3D (Asp-Asp-Asp) domain-containing protein